jgi:hypothetical protein
LAFVFVVSRHSTLEVIKMYLHRTLAAALTAASLSAPVFAIEDHVKQVSRDEYEKLIDGLIKAIGEGRVGVGSGSRPGSGGPAAGSTPPAQGGGEDGKGGNEDSGDGISEDW